MLQLITDANKILQNLVEEKVIRKVVSEDFTSIFGTKWPSIAQAIVEKIKPQPLQGILSNT